MPVSWRPNTEAPQIPTIDNSAYFKVMLNGEFETQRILNILWYRIGLDVIPGNLNLYGAQELAELVYNQCWHNGLQTASSNTYKLQDITVYPFNEFFDPIFSMPYVREVNELGVQTPETAGPANCVTARFVLESQFLGFNGWFPPRRGYISWGPIREVDSGRNGRLTDNAHTFYESNLNCLCVDLSALPTPVTFWPIRVKTTNILNILTLLGYTDIQGVDIRPIATFRRSRLPEA